MTVLASFFGRRPMAYARIEAGGAFIALLLVIVLVSSGCQAARPTMAGVNRTDADAYMRLVLVGGGFRDFLLPRNSIRMLDPRLDVDRAILLDSSCREMGTSVFGRGNVPFSRGGQLYLGPQNESGMTTELSQGSGPAAEPTEVCKAVPTPIDPRLRPVLDGGGSSGDTSAVRILVHRRFIWRGVGRCRHGPSHVTSTNAD